MAYGTLTAGTITPGSGNTLSINEGVSGSAVLDSDTMSGASATTISSSESIKAYVDANSTADQAFTTARVGTATTAAQGVGTGDSPTFAGLNAGDGNITNVGNIALDTISSDAGTSIGVTLGTDAGDDFNVGSGKLVVEGDTGYVGIGTTAPADFLHIYKGNSAATPHAFSAFNIEHSDDLSMNMLTATDKYAAIFFGDSGHANDGGFVYQNGATPSMVIRVNDATRMTIDSSGNIGAPSGTNIYNASDSRLKQDVTNLSGSLAKINQMQGVSFKWIDGFCDSEKDKTHYGLIAQDLNLVDSNLVCEFGNPIEAQDAVTDKDGNVIEEAVEASPHSLDIKDQKIETPLRVEEKYIIPMLVEAVKELSAKVTELENA